MSYDGPTMEQTELLEKIACTHDGYQTGKRNSYCDALAKLGLVECRRSDNVSETWWITKEGKRLLRV